jgi:hypothetical protein
MKSNGNYAEAAKWPKLASAGMSCLTALDRKWTGAATARGAHTDETAEPPYWYLFPLTPRFVHLSNYEQAGLKYKTREDGIGKATCVMTQKLVAEDCVCR